MATSDPPAPAARTFPTTGYDVIDPSVLVEEETIPNYKFQRYYPVHLGEVFEKRYQVVGKLGYGASSTVWLCRDLIEHRYVALKVYVNSSMVHRELPIYNHLNQLPTEHPGHGCIRKLLDSFEVAGPYGRHYCLVHQPLGISLYDLKMRARDNVFSELILRVAIRQLLLAVDYLHDVAHVIHTDLQPNNLLMGVKDEGVFTKFEQDEIDHPVPRKILDDRTIYLSRPLSLTSGPPLLCDLGETRFGDSEHTDDIMPDPYRAPEVILGMKWGYKVDIWNVAMVVWDLFEPRHLFLGRNADNRYDDAYHLAEMIAILGPPPLQFLQRSEHSLQYWDKDGNWKGLAPVPKINLEESEKRLEGEDKEAFLHFLRRMLCWMPENRPTAGEIIYDPWLMEGLFES